MNREADAGDAAQAVERPRPGGGDGVQGRVVKHHVGRLVVLARGRCPPFPQGKQQWPWHGAAQPGGNSGPAPALARPLGLLAQRYGDLA